jgi:hypothetical protein
MLALLILATGITSRIISVSNTLLSTLRQKNRTRIKQALTRGVKGISENVRSKIGQLKKYNFRKKVACQTKKPSSLFQEVMVYSLGLSNL